LRSPEKSCFKAPGRTAVAGQVRTLPSGSRIVEWPGRYRPKPLWAEVHQTSPLVGSAPFRVRSASAFGFLCMASSQYAVDIYRSLLDRPPLNRCLNGLRRNKFPGSRRERTRDFGFEPTLRPEAYLRAKQRFSGNTFKATAKASADRKCVVGATTDDLLIFCCWQRGYLHLSLTDCTGCCSAFILRWSGVLVRGASNASGPDGDTVRWRHQE